MELNEQARKLVGAMLLNNETSFQIIVGDSRADEFFLVSIEKTTPGLIGKVLAESVLYPSALGVCDKCGRSR